MNVFLDYESRSRAELRDVGSYAYARHPSTEILCATYAVGEGPVELWLPGEKIPKVFSCLAPDTRIIGHNFTNFDRFIWQFVWKLPPIPHTQIDDTMCLAYAMGLPGSLADAAASLGLKHQKDVKASRTMLSLAKPRASGEFWTPDTAPEKFDILYKYAIADIEATRELYSKLLKLPTLERKIFELDMLINERGVPLDVKSVDACMGALDDEQLRLREEIQKVSGNRVATPQAVSQIKDYIRVRLDIEIDSVDKAATVEFLANPTLPPDIRRILEIRQEASKSSTAKLGKMAAMAVAREDGSYRSHCNLQYHGANTGRWAGRGIQMQNFPRGKADPSFFKIAREGALSAIYPSAIQAISENLRGFVEAAPGKLLMGADFSQIEARALAWLAGEKKVLRVFEKGEDIYKVAASSIYRVSLDAVTKEQRFVGKVACIAEGELVLTDRGLIPIERLPLDCRVWDGIGWAAHDGPIYKGEKETIEYDGLTATEDHIVWTQEGHSLPFGRCAREQIPLAKTGLGRQEIWFSDDSFAKNFMAGSARQKRVPLSVPACPRSMRRVQKRKMDQFRQFNLRKDARLPVVQPNDTPPLQVAQKTRLLDGISMQQPEHDSVCGIWWARDPIQFSFGTGGMSLDSCESQITLRGVGAKVRDRSDRQRGALRTGEFEVLNTERESDKSENHPLGRFQRSQSSCSRRSPRFSIFVSDSAVRRQYGQKAIPVSQPGTIKSPVPPRIFRKTKRRVWDVLNAGPRNRFTVSGRLVHNCLALGYGGGKVAFAKMAKIYGVEITEDAAEDIKLKWRDANLSIVNFWRALEHSAIGATRSPNQNFSTHGYVGGLPPIVWRRVGDFLWCKLPSNRVLCYPYPRLEIVETPWGTPKETLTYMAQDGLTHKWMRFKTYGGSLAENVTQGVARDVMALAMLRLEESGFPVILTIHDEVICEIAEQRRSELPEFLRIMTDPATQPAWAKGLPIKAEAWVSHRYIKS